MCKINRPHFGRISSFCIVWPMCLVYIQNFFGTLKISFKPAKNPSSSFGGTWYSVNPNDSQESLSILPDLRVLEHSSFITSIIFYDHSQMFVVIVHFYFYLAIFMTSYSIWSALYDQRRLNAPHAPSASAEPVESLHKCQRFWHGKAKAAIASLSHAPALGRTRCGIVAAALN